MPSATTLTIDLPVSGCEPPPLPAAAMRTRRRHRPASLAPGMRIGAWRVERELGRGGMATVYAVVHARFGKRAALKLAHRAVLGPQFTPETFLREARVANLINHPGVAEVFATGTYDGRPYLAMERLAGRSLGARLENGPLPREEALEILGELCTVLDAAHTAGVTHRDLKLDNVFLLDEPGAGGRTKLLDWGMARVAREDDPLRGLIAGTLTYVAPEQFRNEDITPAADIYSLAVLAYLLLLGQAPFTASTDIDLIHCHLRDAPPSPRKLWAAIPAELEATLVAMLAKQPQDRPALADIARALRNARDRLRPRTLRWLTPTPKAMPRDVLGRPAVPVLATRPTRIAGAALGIALTVLSVLQLLSA
ncbi:MAG TPA: serine/threonine-protein kinase [Kofleriaceae bacterium]|nr:serine/threonine-protein kinase [Kofleriaceae bacterium]